MAEDMHPVRRIAKTVADSPWFQHFITLVIIAAGVVVGMETYRGFAEQHHGILHVLDNVILAIFVVEIVIKMAAEGKRPWRYFLDPWNVFDFLIVAACFMPIGSQYAMVLRLARLLRVLKLVRALPRLQILVSALLKSIPSIGYISILLCMQFYLYAVTATFLFSENDPLHFGNLQISMLSLFRAVTLEDWTDLMYIQMYGCDQYGYEGIENLCRAPKAHGVVSPIFFVTFVLVGTMIILNLFIGVIMTGMDEAQRESDHQARTERESLMPDQLSVADELDTLVFEVERLQKRIEAIRQKAASDGGAALAAERASPAGSDGERGEA